MIKDVYTEHSGYNDGSVELRTRFFSGSDQGMGIFAEPMEKIDEFIKKVYQIKDNLLIERFESLL